METKIKDYYLEEYDTEKIGYIKFLYLITPFNDLDGYKELEVPLYEVEGWLNDNGYMSGEDITGDCPTTLRYHSWKFDGFFGWEENNPDAYEIMQKFLNSIL